MTPCNLSVGARLAPCGAWATGEHCCCIAHYPHIEDTLRSFREVLHPNMGDRVEMNSVQSESIAGVYVSKERNDMRNRLFAGLLASVVLGAVSTIPAYAGCLDNNTCSGSARSFGTKTVQKTAIKVTPAISAKRKTTANPGKRVHASFGSTQQKVRSVKRKSTRRAAASLKVASSRTGSARGGGGGSVAAMIRSMAPTYGVPTWFALRIAKVESNFNPNVRGAAGEYGVYQLKCATAKGIGFSGNCSALLNPRINVQYGLIHLSKAMKSSRGNLRLAASKHNGGLGRKTMVHGYVAKVF